MNSTQKLGQFAPGMASVGPVTAARPIKAATEIS